MINVTYNLATTWFKTKRILDKLASEPLLAFDVETQSLWSQEEIKEANKIVNKFKSGELKENEFTQNEVKLIKQIARSSGLSYPSLIKVTHFIFSHSKDHSYIIIPNSHREELQIWKWLANYKGKLLVHNTLFDLKIMYERIQTLPVDYEDTQLMARVLTNDADEFESKVGLKHLMGSYYSPKWTMIGEDGYFVKNLKNEAFLRYSAIDGASTFYLYELLHEELGGYNGEHKRPWEWLPTPMPRDYDPGPTFFYYQIIKPMIPDFIKMMHTGLLIDEEQSQNLKQILDNEINEIQHKLNNNPIICKFQNKQIKQNRSKLHKQQIAKLRTIDYYYKPYKNGDMTHRTALINYILQNDNYAHDQREKWTVNDLKKYKTIVLHYLFDQIISKTVDPNDKIVVKAMESLAQQKLDIYNKAVMAKVEQVTEEQLVPPFNPGSSQQKYKLLSDMLGYESNKESKAYLKYMKELSYGKIPVDKRGKEKKKPNRWSWGRDELEFLLKTLPNDKKDLKELLQLLVDYSFRAIVRNNFIEAFDAFTIDSWLHGNIKLLGAVSGRNTSDKPSMLNMPSSKSILAKPIKKCFKAPDGFLVYQADFTALEEVCLANLSKDKNKLAIFQQGLDSHCFNSYGYYKDEIEAILPRQKNESLNDYIKRYKKEVDNNDDLKDIRQKSKSVSFKLNYLGMVDSDKGGAITNEIYDNYHNTLYKEVSDFLDNMLESHKQNGYTHIGLGFRIYTDKIDKHFRTIWNAYAGQFWSMLSLITVNELNYRIQKEGLESDIIFNSTIYDAVYCYVRNDPYVIKWLNDNLIEVMTKNWLIDQPIKNQAEGEVGHTWVPEVTIPNNASLEEIKQILKEIT